MLPLTLVPALSARDSVRRGAARLGAALLAPLLLAGLTACDALPGAGSSEPTPPDPAESLSFSFDLRGGEQYIDQTLTITNEGTEPVVFEAVLTALDEAGEPLGGRRGRHRLRQPGRPARGGARPGPRHRQVLRARRRAAVDVAVELEAVEAVDYPAVTAPVEAVAVDARGEEVRYPGLLSRVELRNPNEEAVEVRTVYIVWEPPVDGAPQQAEVAVELAPRTTVPAGGEAVVRPSERSLEHHPCLRRQQPLEPQGPLRRRAALSGRSRRPPRPVRT